MRKAFSSHGYAKKSVDLGISLYRHSDELHSRAFARSSRIGEPVRVVSRVSAVPPHVTSWLEPDDSSDSADLKNALKAARERGHTRVAKILKSKDMLSADEFADYLGTSRVLLSMTIPRSPMALSIHRA
jgi:hypothetical protein